MGTALAQMILNYLVERFVMLNISLTFNRKQEESKHKKFAGVMEKLLDEHD